MFGISSVFIVNEEGYDQRGKKNKNFLSLKRKASWKLFTEHFFMLVKAD